ncbi:MAG: FixH family protein [Alphaproteobacteria bacterium]|nr:FixH family protein [Alphaproteobacteria bacterium]
MFVLGMVIVFIVNGIMAWLAITTWSGLAVEQAYDRGRGYNHVIAEAERQQALGWQLALALDAAEGGAARPTGTARLTLTAHDRNGAPMDTLVVTGTLRRPVERMADLPVTFQPIGQGRYRAEIALPKTGLWDARLTARGAAGSGPVQLHQRLIVP